MKGFATSLFNQISTGNPGGIFQVLRPGVSLALDSDSNYLGLFLPSGSVGIHSVAFLKPRTSQMLQDFGAKWCIAQGFI